MVSQVDGHDPAEMQQNLTSPGMLDDEHDDQTSIFCQISRNNRTKRIKDSFFECV